MPKFTEDDINRILNKKHDDDTSMDVFNLHFVLCVGNTKTARKWDKYLKQMIDVSEWDVVRYAKWAEHSLPISIEDFDECETEEDVFDVFSDVYRNVLREELL
jgi:hypothetical protein